MKFQDIFFLILFLLLIFKKDSKLSLNFGLICLILSIPLFALWVFFTAERLTWYASLFIFLSIIIEIFKFKKIHNSQRKI